MHSSEFDELGLLYASGELAELERLRFEAHRGGCADCAELAAALASGRRAADRAAVSLPQFAAERIVLRAFQGERRAPAPGYARLRRGLAAAALLSALALFVRLAGLERARPAELAWTNGVERGLRNLDEDLAALDGELTVSKTSIEIEEDFRRLEGSAGGIEEGV